MGVGNFGQGVVVVGNFDQGDGELRDGGGELGDGVGNFGVGVGVANFETKCFTQSSFLCKVQK